jgi:hypothetical protein
MCTASPKICIVCVQTNDIVEVWWDLTCLTAGLELVQLGSLNNVVKPTGVGMSHYLLRGIKG